MQMLFAQQGGGGGGGPPPEFAGMLAVIIGIMCVALAIGLVIQIFFCLSLSKALQRVRPELRELEPGQVWLLLIPFFNLYWIFVITSKIPQSVGREFRERGMHRRGEDYGATVGKWYAICMILSIIPYVGGIAGIVGLVCWILFWVKIAGFSNQLASDGDYGGGDYDDRDEDDDRPRKKRRHREEEADEAEDDDDDRGRRRSRDWS